MLNQANTPVYRNVNDEPNSSASIGPTLAHSVPTELTRQEDPNLSKTILITGSTDGIGLEAAKSSYSQGHHILLHGGSIKNAQSGRKSTLWAIGKNNCVYKSLNHKRSLTLKRI